MEQWSWPPRYDEGYRPAAGQEHWFPRRETMPAEERDERIVERIREVMAYAWEHSPFYRRRWDDAGVHPSSVRSLDDFEKVPVVRKEELRADQAAHEPFGSYLCVPESEVKHVNGTSGTTGRPTAFGISERDWRSVANAHARVMWAMGIRPHDTVLVASPLSRAPGCAGVPVRCRPDGADRAHGVVDAADEGDRLLRHAVVRVAPRGDRPVGRGRPGLARTGADVLLR
jgi:phenylacetate-CoA ligase